MPPVTELVFRRATINLTDAARLGEGEDLNDALLDFFVRLGQTLIPQGGEDKAPVCYLGSLFFKQLTSAFVTSGEDGWKNVQNWAKRKAGGMFKPQYVAFSVPINEDLKDDKGEPAGNHWWLALLLNPPGGALGQTTAVMCLDSMQRRDKIYDPPLQSYFEGAKGKYTLDITKVEQAGYLLIISFDARGDGSLGPLHRPEASWLEVDGIQCRNPELGLRINSPGTGGYAGRFDGTITFSLEGRIRSSCFILFYGGGQYKKVTIEFDPFTLTKMQKLVSRYLGGYLAKEWQMNGPSKTTKFEKQSARALVADVHQQENLNDCGVFVLENTLRSLAMTPDFLKSMASATPAVLKSFPWPSQSDITTRKLKLKAIVARLFEVAAEKGTSDVEVLLKGNDTLKSECLKSLTDDRASELDKWAEGLQKELGARQQDKTMKDKEIADREAEVQARRDEERRKREEEEEQRKKEEREFGKKVPEKKKVVAKEKKRRAASGSPMSLSRSPSRKIGREKSKANETGKSKGKKPPRRSDSSRSDSRDVAKKSKKDMKESSKKVVSSKIEKRRGRSPSEDSRSRSDSRDRAPGKKKRKR